MIPHFPIWSFGPKIESVDGICHQTDSMNRFYLDVKTGPYRVWGLFEVLGCRYCHLLEGVWYINDWDTGSSILI